MIETFGGLFFIMRAVCLFFVFYAPHFLACGRIRAVLHKTVMPQRATFAHLVQAFLLGIRQVFLVVITCKYAQISSF